MSALFQLFLELLDLEPGEAGEAHVENRLRLALGQLEPLPQSLAGRLRIPRLTNDLDHLIDVVDGDLESLEHMLPVLGRAQIVLAAAHHDLVAMLEEVLQHLLQRHDPGHPVHEGQHDHAEGRLHLRVLVQLIQHDIRNGIPLQLDHQPDAIPVGLVPEIGNVLDATVANELGDLLDQPRFVHHERDLGDHDPLATSLFLFDLRPRSHDDPAAAALVRLDNPVPAVDEPTGGKVRTGHVFQQFIERAVGLVDDAHTGRDNLPEVVWRNVRRHAHRDPRRAVDQQVRDAGWQHDGLAETVVEVGLEIDCLAVDVRQHLERDRGEASLRVSVGRRAVAVHRSEVPLSVDQRVTQGEILHHADQRIVHGGVAVRVVFAQDIAHDRGALLVRPGRRQAGFLHRVEDAAVDRLQPVPNVGQRTLHDHAHRVVDERLSHLVFEQTRLDPVHSLGCLHETLSMSVEVRCGRWPERPRNQAKNLAVWGVRRDREGVATRPLTPWLDNRPIPRNPWPRALPESPPARPGIRRRAARTVAAPTPQDPRAKSPPHRGSFDRSFWGPVPRTRRVSPAPQAS